VCVIIQNSNLITYPHISLVGILASRCMMFYYHFYNHCFPEDKYDILEYSWVKVTMVSVRLQIFLFALTNTNTYVMNKSLILHACYESVDDIGVRNLLQLVLALSEVSNVVTQAFIILVFAS
jgi:hypothetical protein